MIELYGNGGIYFVRREQILSNTQWIDKWKVLTSKGYNGGDNFPHKILGTPIVAAPGSACTETYVVCGVYDSEIEARNFETYLRTKFFRFLVSLRKNTQDVTQSRFKFVPMLDMKKRWTDEKLYKEFDISEEEQRFIASIVKEMPESKDLL